MNYATDLKNFLDKDGQLLAYPARYKLQISALFCLASKFEPNKKYSEKEVNVLLLKWHTFGDWVLLRRELYDKRFLDRLSDCTAYWLEEAQPLFCDFGF